MLKLDNNLLQEIGLGGLPEEQKKAMLQHIYETLELRVGTTLANQMTDQQLQEFERFIDAGGDNSQAEALKWLETNLPNYKDVVQQVFAQLKGEIAQMAPQIMANTPQATGVPQPTQPVQPTYAQPPQPQPAPMSQPSYPQQPYPQPQPVPGMDAQPPQPQFAQPQSTPMSDPMGMPQQPPVSDPQQFGQPQPQQTQPLQPMPSQWQPPQSPSPQGQPAGDQPHPQSPQQPPQAA
jgi:hypothetical protein